MKHNQNQVPQMQVRSNLVAGESVEACLTNLDYWTKQLEGKCAKKAASNAPYKETEMKWWQAGSV